MGNGIPWQQLENHSSNTSRSMKGWSPGQMFNCFWNLEVLIDSGEIIQVDVSFLAGLAMRGDFLPAGFNLTEPRQRCPDRSSTVLRCASHTSIPGRFL